MKIVMAVGFFPKIQKFNIRKMINLEFHDFLVVRILGFDSGFILWSGNWDPTSQDQKWPRGRTSGWPMTLLGLFVTGEEPPQSLLWPIGLWMSHLLLPQPQPWISPLSCCYNSTGAESSRILWQEKWLMLGPSMVQTYFRITSEILIIIRDSLAMGWNNHLKLQNSVIAEQQRTLLMNTGSFHWYMRN